MFHMPMSYTYEIINFIVTSLILNSDIIWMCVIKVRINKRVTRFLYIISKRVCDTFRNLKWKLHLPWNLKYFQQTINQNPTLHFYVEIKWKVGWFRGKSTLISVSKSCIENLMRKRRRIFIWFIIITG